MVTENTFTGEYRYILDVKSRINIPAKFRSALSPDNECSFVITRGMDPCIVAYPLLEWQQVEVGLRTLSSASKTYRSFIRSIVRYATPVKMDKQGRIQITSILKDYADLDKDVLIIGVVNKIELWNPVRLDKLEDTTLSIDPEQFEDLADKIIL